MAGRPGRSTGACPKTSIRNPGLTRAAQLRQAKSAAFVKENRVRDDVEAARVGLGECGPPRKARVPKFTKGPPPAEPRRIDMKKPGMTKAMLARLKHTEEFQKNLQKRNEPVFQKPAARRTAAPLGGDARFGREPRKKPNVPGPCSPEKIREERPAAPQVRKECGIPGPSKSPRGRSGMPLPQAQSSMIPPRTTELAESMNAEVVQAEPIGSGPVQSIVIPPGTVSQCRTTIVSLPQNMDASAAANRSMQVITESLDEQDAYEAAAVNNRLCELQHARRDFVMAVANVGGNVINLNEISGGRSQCAAIAEPERCIYQVPEVEDNEMFRINYGREHPDVIAGREFRERVRAAMLERETEREMERRFARMAREDCGLRLEVPIEQDIMEGDISWEEDEETGMILPCASRIKASMPPIPRRPVAAVADTIDVDELERFFNVEKFPPPPPDRNLPPRGREGLHRDLWELDDPWYRECPPPDYPDLIDFGDY